VDVEVELLCNHCELETVHKAIIQDGYLERLTCSVCGTVTRMPVMGRRPAKLPKAPGVRFAPFAFGGRRKPHVLLGSGPVLIEGSIQTHGTSRTGDLLGQATRLREADCHLIRLPITEAAQLSGIKTVHAATALPVAVDIGAHLELLPNVVAAQADAIIVTVAGEAEAELLRGVDALPVFVRVTGLQGGPQAWAEAAEAIVRKLQEVGVTRVVLSLDVPDFGQFAEAYRAVHKRMQVPLRLEVTREQFAADHARAHLALGSLVADGMGSVVAPSGAADPVKGVDEITELLKVLGYLELPYGHDRARTFRYYTKRTLDRLISKPGRMVAELGADPNAFVTSLPRRALTKPLRLVQEFRRIFNKIS